MTKLGKKQPGKLFRWLGIATIALTLMGISGGSAVLAGANLGVPSQAGATTTATQYKVLVMHAYFRSIAERDQLAAEFGAEEMPTTNGYLTILGDQTMLSDLQSRGLRVEIDQAESQRLSTISVPSSDPNTFFGGYRTVEDMQAFLNQEAAAHPNLATVVDYGDSWCKANPGSCTQPAPNNGYDLLALHITNQAIPGPKPAFWFVGGNHVREIAVPELAMRYISWLLDNYNSSADARWLVDYQDIWIVPIMNPDGHHIVEAGGGGNSPYYQRKNANNSNGCTTWPPQSGNQFGTDLNRNFPFMWNCCGGSSGAPCSEVYRGASVDSEPETQALTAIIRTTIPDQRGPNINDPAPITTTGVLQDMHQYGGENLYPWGIQSGPAPNGPDLMNIGAHMSAANANPPGNSYDYCQPPNCLYTVDGDSSDWGYGELGIPAYTSEVGNDFLIPYSQVDGVWNTNKGMLTYLSKIARTPYLLAHGPDDSINGASVITTSQGIAAQLQSTINFAWTGNTASQNVGAAEYYVDTPPWAGGTPVAMQPADGSFDSPTEAVVASLDTSALSVGRHIIFMRGRGVNNYQTYQTWGPPSAIFLNVTAPAGTATVTATAGPPSATSTSTGVATAAATASMTANVTATATSVSTSVSTGTTTATVQATSTSGATTGTATTQASATSQPSASVQASATSTSTVQPTACPIQFTDVPSMGSGSTFYTFVRCLVCRGVVSGYPCGGVNPATGGAEPCDNNQDGYYRPGNNVSRGQLSKIIANAAGLNSPIPTGQQSFSDVPPSSSPSSFYVYIERLASTGAIAGYPCGSINPQTGQPLLCDSDRRPYFLPTNSATRGQISKIVALAAGYQDILPTGQQTFTDVPPNSPFYQYIEELASRHIIDGYDAASGRCEAHNPPYAAPCFLYNDFTTRGQMAKIASNAFFPNCQTPASPQAIKP